MKLPLVRTPFLLRPLLERWFSAWIARTEARWHSAELRQRYY